MPVYSPPLRGAPGGRIGGGTRGAAGEEIRLSVLAPDDRALTLSEQPTLYWFISAPTRFPVEVVIMDPGAVEPVLETRVAPPIQGGIHAIRLRDHGIRLAIGISYRWYVAVVPDAGRRSRDVLAGGTIERIEAPADLSATLGQATRDDRAFVYAKAGLWYDALDAISELIETSAGDPGPRRQRAALLAQVGLPEVGER